MTDEEGTEEKVNGERPAKLAKNFMFLLTHLPRRSFKTAIRKIGGQNFS
ncbi:MAG: hypothetical protein ACRENG_05480 [bacterium]